MELAFGTQSYRLRSLPLSAQRMVNYCLEVAPPKAKTYAACVPAYGIVQKAVIEAGYCRGGCVINGVPYAVYGSKFYRIKSNFDVVELGTIPGSHYVDMAGDEINVMLVTDGLGYYWNGATFQLITSSEFPGAEWVECLDGYFIVGAPNSGQFYISANRNPASWDGLDFGTAEKYPDDLVAGIVNYGELYLFGKESFEVWYDSGNSDFPFTRTPNGFGELGCLSRFGVAKADNGVIFLGHDGVFYRLNGYEPQRISTPAVEQAVEDYADKTCFALSWNEGGHKFVSFSFDEGTWVYDVSTGLWHERVSYGLPRWRPLFILRAFDTWLVGDFYTNALGELSADAFTEYDFVMRGSVTSPPVAQENKRVVHSRLELVFEQGVGLATGQGSDPQVMLRFSDDGGRTWSTEKWRPLGKVGEFRTRALFNRLGQARDRVYEYVVTDPVRRTLILATADSVVGNY